MTLIKQPRDEQRRLTVLLNGLPRPISLLDHVRHYLQVRRLIAEIHEWETLESIGVVLVGFIPSKGGDDLE